MSRDPRTECAAHRWRASGSRAAPSTRRASDITHTLCHVPRVTEVTFAEAGVPAGTHSVVISPCRSRTVRCGECDVHGVRHERARTCFVERWATTALARPSSDPSDGGDG